MYLGIDQQTGLIYEGFGSPDVPSLPLPTVTQAKLIEKPEDWTSLPGGLSSDPFRWIFLEDSFDAATRIRRGRLYEPWGNSQPSTQQVGRHPYDPASFASNVGLRVTKTLNVYSSCYELLKMPNKGLGAKLALGSNLSSSAWRIIQTEVLVSRAVMVTLKALSTYGIVPELNAEKVPARFRRSVAQAINKVLESAFRESPISVIDQCRNALTVVLSRWLVQQKHDDKALSQDLAKVAEAIGAMPYRKYCAANLARVVALLHSRGKDNVQHVSGARQPIEEDAEMALHALGFVLRDIGWVTDESTPLADTR